jgi:hypothetical protein
MATSEEYYRRQTPTEFLPAQDWPTVGKELERLGVHVTDELPQETLELQVRVNTRLKRSYGRFCHYREDTPPLKRAFIEIHRNVHKEPAMYRRTLLHELAHAWAVVDGVPPSEAHGWRWRQRARKLGIAGERTSDDDAQLLDKGRPRKVVAVCSKCRVPLKRTRALPKGKTYRHSGCGGRFEPPESDAQLVRIRDMMKELENA